METKMRNKALLSMVALIMAATVVYGAITAAPSTMVSQNKYEFGDGMRVNIEVYTQGAQFAGPDAHLVKVNDVASPFTSFNIEYFYTNPYAAQDGKDYIFATMTKAGTNNVKRGDTVTLVFKDVNGNIVGEHAMSCKNSQNKQWSVECH